MQKAGIRCPEVVSLKKHVLVMSFIGQDQVPAPKLKEVKLSSEDMKNAYYQVLHVRSLLYENRSSVMEASFCLQSDIFFLFFHFIPHCAYN